MSDTHSKAVAVVEHRDMERINPALRAIMERDLPTETVREMLALQREWEAGEAKKAYTAALVGLKRDLPTVIARDKTVDFKNKAGVRTHYTHTSLACLMEAATDALTSHGFSLGWEPKTEGGQVTVTCRLTHAAGHSETCSITAPIDNSGNKSPAQGVASTITLLQRYTAMSLLGIATADMGEPKVEAPPDEVNSKRNLKAVGALRKYGKSAADAESYLGRPVAQWTAADIEKLRAWVQPAAKPQPQAEPEDVEPPHDPSTGEVYDDGMPPWGEEPR